MKILKVFSFAFIFIFVSKSFSSQETDNVFTVDKFGLSVEKPSGWSFVDSIHYARVQLNNGEETKDNPMNILVGFRGKLKDNSRALCLIDEVKGNPEDLLSSVSKRMARMKRKDKDFTAIKNPREILSGDLKLTHAAYSLLVKESGTTIRKGFSTWYFVVNSQVLRLECTAHEKSFELGSAEFDTIVQSLKLN